MLTLVRDEAAEGVLADLPRGWWEKALLLLGTEFDKLLGPSSESFKKVKKKIKRTMLFTCSKQQIFAAIHSKYRMLHCEAGMKN